MDQTGTATNWATNKIPPQHAHLILTTHHSPLTPPSSDSSYDTIIIGAGMSGLAAGIRLAHFEQKVCILEQHYTIGGLNSFYRLNGRDHDVGLHAVTNFTAKGTKRGPLARMLRQLRFKWDDFALAPQIGSSVVFPGVELNFTNDFELLQTEIAEKFPGQKDNFRKLVSNLLDYDDIDQSAYAIEARDVLNETIDDPLLVEMLFCPLMWYGNAREREMDYGQFCIMFRSIYMEGFARPFKGVRLILKHLVRRFRDLGGELKLRSGVKRIQVEDGRAVGLELDNGTKLEAKRIISSAGRVETLRMTDGACCSEESQAGCLSFIESIAVLDKQPKQLNHDKTIVFYNDSQKFHWETPKDDLCDVRTGVICSPNNFYYDPADGELPEGIIRVTSLANFDRWTTMPKQQYYAEKKDWFDRAMAAAIRWVPDFRGHIVDTDMFTPKTIHYYTRHDNGAVYGAPVKVLDGRTHLPNLFLCGTDQGFVGIIGAIISGISIANQHCLRHA